jgi:hypothetical protein
MGRLAFGPGHADGAVAFIQVACSIYQGYTSRVIVFPWYISKATMLVVSESGASRKKQDKMGKTSSWTFDIGVGGVNLTYPYPKTFFLDASSFGNVLVHNEFFHRVAPVRLTLKSVDGLGAVDVRKRPDF